MTSRARRFAAILLLSGGAAAVFVWLVLQAGSPARNFLPFPADRDCAIAVTDDTDGFQFENTAPVYRLLNEVGWRVTKTVWAFDSPDYDPERAGLSLESPEYLRWALDQAARGNEIALHSPTAGDDTRETTIAAHEKIKALFGVPTRVEIFHRANKEAFFWGAARLPSPLLRRAYDWKSHERFFGQDPQSRYYWLDLSRSLVRYVRTYTTSEIDTWALNPSMPYEDPRTPQAPLWFSSSNGRHREEFVRLLSAKNVRRLAAQHGVSIVYTHFSGRFVEPVGDGAGRRVRADVEETLRRCAGDPRIELLPAGEVLDRLRAIQLVRKALSRGERRIRLPADLVAAAEKLSVVSPAAEFGDQPAPGGAKPHRVAMGEWLRSHGLALEATDKTVFDDPVRLGSRERWRLVLLWLREQILHKT